MTEFTGFQQPGYTAIPNELLDTFLPLLGEAELKVALFVARKTFGWHKRDDDLSLSQIAKGTGLSKPAVITATASLAERGLLIKRTRGQNIAHNYRLNVQTSKADLPDDASKDTLPPQTSKATLPEVVNEVNYPSKAALPQLVKPVYPQKKLKKLVKETERKGEEVVDTTSPPPPPVEDTSIQKPEPTPAIQETTRKEPTPQQALVAALSETTGMDTRLNGSRLGKAAAQLARVEATPDLIRQHYGPGGWWYTSDWRGQKGEFPRPEQVIETWGQWTRAAPVANGKPPGRGRNSEAWQQIANSPTLMDLRRERERKAEEERRRQYGIK